MAKRKNAGFSEARGGILLKMVLTILIALVMTSTVFVPVMGSNAANVDENNSGAGDSSFDNDTSSKDFNISAPETIDIEHREPYIPYVDDEDSPVIVMDRPDYVVKNETEENTLSENPPIEMSDMSCHPLELPDLKDTHLSWRDMINWERLFPKFMAMEGKNNVLSVELKNVDDNRTYDVKLDIYEISPEGNKTLIGEEHYGMMFPSQKTSNVDIWVPENAGRNYIYGEIYVSTDCSFSWFGPEKEWVLVNTFKKSFNVVPGDRSVRIINGDWTVEQPTIIESETVVVNGDMYVNAPLEIRNTTVLGDNLWVNNTYTIYAGSNNDIAATSDGQFKVEVAKTGTLEVYGELCNNPNDIYYNFYVYGNLTVDKDPYAEEAGSISEVNGDPDNLDAPGGIIVDNAVGKVEIRNGATIYNCLSHALWVKNSRAEIYDATIRDNGGDGIVAVNGAVVDVRGSNLSWNGRHGINVNNAVLLTGKYDNKDNIIAWNAGNGVKIENVIDPHGRPAYVPGADMGYYVWFDSDILHVRCTSDDVSRNFDGTVNFYSISEPIDVSSYNVDMDDDYTIRPSSVSFHLIVNGTEKGFDIESEEGAYAILDLKIDGSGNSSLIYIGKDTMNPADSIFYIRNYSYGREIGDMHIAHNFDSGISVDGSNISINNCHISNNGVSLRFFDDAETDAGWTATGLWHRVHNGTKVDGEWTEPVWNRAHRGKWSWWYGYEHDGTGDYNTTDDNGEATSNHGGLLSPNIDLTDVKIKNATLSFWSWHETEPEDSEHPDPPTIPPEPGTPQTESEDEGYDVRYVAVGTDEDNYSIYILDDPPEQWNRILIDISEYSGNVIKVYFGFYTGDELYNNYSGWYLDDISVLAHEYGKISRTPLSAMVSGVFASSSKNVVIKDSNIEHNYLGVYSMDSISGEVSNTAISNNSCAIYLAHSGGWNIHGNDNITNNTNGICISDEYSVMNTENTWKDSVPTGGMAYSDNRILVKLRTGNRNEVQSLQSVLNGLNMEIESHTEISDIYVLKLNGDISVEEAIEKLSENSFVEYAEPDYEAEIHSVPNDEMFGSKWGLEKIGAPFAWNTTTGSRDVVVAVLDTGIDVDHKDLRDNMWINPGEIGINGTDNSSKATNGRDDDGDGYIDDVYGIDAILGKGVNTNRSNDTEDGESQSTTSNRANHGTHVAGIIGAVGNNSIGVCGVNWNVSLMSLRCLNASGYLYMSSAIEAIDYAIMMKQRGVNVRVLSASWGSCAFSKALYDEIEKARENDILFVVSAGNSHVNDDYYPVYPNNYNLTNIISVAATDPDDNLADFSNLLHDAGSCYGPSTVDVAAPGKSILSTIPGNQYAYMSGTSMAAPFVSGLAALIAANNPEYNYSNIKNVILSSVDQIPQLQGKIVTGGRINASRAINLSPGDPEMLIHSPGIGDKILKDSDVAIVVSVTDGINPINGADVTAILSDGETIKLLDDGKGVDQLAGDGYYSAKWSPHKNGRVTMKIIATTESSELHSVSYVYVIGMNRIVDNTLKNSDIYVGATAGNAIKGNTISGVYAGIYVDSARNTLISDNTITDSHYGIYVSSKRLFSFNTTLRNNTCSNNSIGILLDMRSDTFMGYISFNNDITYNTCSNNSLVGIYVSGYTFTEILHNNISMSEYGIYIYNSPKYILIKNNTNISNNLDGICVYNSEVEIAGNEIFSNDRGIYFYSSSGVVRDNTVYSNKPPYVPPNTICTGMDIVDSKDMAIYDNKWGNNIVDIFSLNSRNISISNDEFYEPTVNIEIYPNLPYTAGIRALYSEMYVEDSTFNGCVYGVYFENMDSKSTVYNNKFRNLSLGVTQPQQPGYPIYMKNSPVSIDSNQVEYSTLYGIYLENSDADIENNTVTSRSDAIYITWSKPMIANNTISSTDGWGIYSSYAEPANAGTNGSRIISTNNFGTCGLGQMIQYWKMQILVVDNGNPVADAEVTVYDNVGGDPIIDGVRTNSEGLTEVFVLPQYAYNSTGEKIQYSPYLIIINGKLVRPDIHLENNLQITYDLSTNKATITPL